MAKAEKDKPLGAGKSSFDLIDSQAVFGELGLQRGSTFLDVACGRGDYTLAASKAVRKSGLIYAVDLWEEGIATLQEKAAAQGIENIEALVCDVGKKIPLETGRVDVCLMSTVLHDLVQTGDVDGTLKEVGRVLKSQGSLAVIEFKKIDGPPGPPISVRLTPDETESLVLPHGFRKKRTLDVGLYNYMMTFGLT
ncbi:MAG: class I SAM-dependent methyltransferase [Proteobacteria bacterium]|nr:class I SAM-dependent methyltransferase [Pseudomonadota bacterium]